MEGEQKWCVVTGGRGFAARHLVEMLIRSGRFSVRIADLGPSIKLEPSEEKGLLGEALQSGRAEYVSADLRDKAQVLKGQIHPICIYRIYFIHFVFIPYFQNKIFGNFMSFLAWITKLWGGMLKLLSVIGLNILIPIIWVDLVSHVLIPQHAKELRLFSTWLLQIHPLTITSSIIQSMCKVKNAGC